MEVILQNSMISTTDLSDNSNPSTARLLINHIKRLVEDDMKMTVEAFKLIENEIVFVSNRSNKSSVQSRHSASSSTRQYGLTPQNYNEQPKYYQENFPPSTSRGSVYTVNNARSERSKYNTSEMSRNNSINYPIQNKSNKSDSIRNSSSRSATIRNISNGSNVQYQNSPQSSRISSPVERQLYAQTLTDQNDLYTPRATSTPKGSISSSSYSKQLRQKQFSSTSKEESYVENTMQYFEPYKTRNSNADKWNRRTSSNRSNIYSNNTSKLDITTTDAEDFVSLTRVRSMYSQFTKELEGIMNRISQRFNNGPNVSIAHHRKPALQTISCRINDDFSPTWTYGNSSTQLSVGASNQSPSKNKKDRKKIRLPQLFVVNGRTRTNTVSSGSTIGNENVAHLGGKYDKNGNIPKKNYDTLETTDYTSQTSDHSLHVRYISPQTTDDVPQTTDDIPESTDNVQTTDYATDRTDDIQKAKVGTDERTEETDENSDDTVGRWVFSDGSRNINSTTASPINQTKRNDSSRRESYSLENINVIIVAADVHNPHELEMNHVNNDVIITDIGSDTSFSRPTSATPKTAGKDFSLDEELTDTISSSLLTTPKTTVRDTPHEWTDLDAIASLINQASPNRRIVIKKKLPEVAVKGYNKHCNEKLIFSGNKITHVKTDRKTVCRNLNPKHDIDN